MIPLTLHPLKGQFSVGKLRSTDSVDLSEPFRFLSVTNEEISLLCPTECMPADALARQDGLRGIRIEGMLDFSLIGILSSLTSALAERSIPVFAVSTFNTDYLFVDEMHYSSALDLFTEIGNTIA